MAVVSVVVSMLAQVVGRAQAPMIKRIMQKGTLRMDRIRAALIIRVGLEVLDLKNVQLHSRRALFVPIKDFRADFRYL